MGDSPVKAGLLRKMMTGVPSSNSSEANERWDRHKKGMVGGPQCPQTALKVPATSRLQASSSPYAVSQQGSVRERARAYEQKHAAAQAALIGVTRQGQDGAGRRSAKSSYDGSVKASAPAASFPAHIAPAAQQQVNKHPSRSVAPSEGASTPREDEDNKENSVPAPESQPSKTPSSSPTKKNLYELPVSPRPFTPMTPRSNAAAAAAAAVAQAKHVSSPPTGSRATLHASENGARPSTIPASAFLAARERANSSPRPSEWIALPPKPRLEERPKSQLGNRGADLILYGSTSPSTIDAPGPSKAAPTPLQYQLSTPLTPPVRREDSDEKPLSSYLPPLPFQHDASDKPIQVHSSSAEASQSSDPVLRGNKHQKSRPVSYAGPSQDMSRTKSEPTAKNGLISNVRMYTRPVSSVDSPVVKSVESFYPSTSKSATGGTASQGKSSSVGRRARSSTVSQQQSPVQIEEAFENMINALNLPSTVARKMLALDLSVKTGMLKSGSPASGLSKSTASSSSASSMPTSPQAISSRLAIPDYGDTAAKIASPRKRPAMVRKVRSFMSIGDKGKESEGTSSTELPEGFMLVHAGHGPDGVPPAIPSTNDADPTVSRAAAAQALMLKTATLKTLDPKQDLRKLRVLLRNESLEWLNEWVKFGGYKALMERLHEVMSVEWREEQHDDQVLLELLKCFRGLLMTTTGRKCLAHYSPSPYRPLVELLYSDKKPGDLAARQAIVEIILGLYEVFPDGSPAVGKEHWRQPWGPRENFGLLANTSPTGSPVLPMPNVSMSRATTPIKLSKASSEWESPDFGEDFTFLSGTTKASAGGESDHHSRTHETAHELVKSLMIGPPNEKEQATVDFMQKTRRVRQYKLWMDEIIGTLSDYFWIFCHSNNTYWRLENLEEDKVEEPKVPGGMTGGVEYEAMEYCAAHLRLINQVAKSCPSRDAAQTLHGDLFFSGMDKVILTLRKCSTTYYPQIHLELARYIDICLNSGYPLHEAVRKHVEPVKALSSPVIGSGPTHRDRREPAGPRRHQRSRTEGLIQLH